MEAHRLADTRVPNEEPVHVLRLTHHRLHLPKPRPRLPVIGHPPQILERDVHLLDLLLRRLKTRQAVEVVPTEIALERRPKRVALPLRPVDHAPHLPGARRSVGSLSPGEGGRAEEGEGEDARPNRNGVHSVSPVETEAPKETNAAEARRFTALSAPEPRKGVMEQKTRGVAVVTNADAGLGQALAAVLADAGWDLALAGPVLADETRAAVEAMGRRCLAAETDPADDRAAGRLADAVLEGLGEASALVLTGGETERAAMTVAFLPHMARLGKGRILLVPSNEEDPTDIATLAAELAPDRITLNAAAPRNKPDAANIDDLALARAATLLLAPEAETVTGQTLLVGL